MALYISNAIRDDIGLASPRTPKRCRSLLDENGSVAKKLRSSLSKTMNVVHCDLPRRASTSLSLQRVYSEHSRAAKDRFISDLDENVCPIKITPRSRRFADRLSNIDDSQLTAKYQKTSSNSTLTDAMQSLQRHLTKRLYDCPLYTATTSAEFNLVKVPERVLDAPHMEDDFYAHPVSWSQKNMLAIETCQSVVYCNMDSGELEQFKDVSVFGHPVHLEWSPDSTKLAYTDHKKGKASILDTVKNRKIASFRCCNDKACEDFIGAYNWRDDNLLSVAYSDGSIRNYDLRTKFNTAALEGHKSNICGLQWSPDKRYLASGDGHGVVCCWDYRMPTTLALGLETGLTQKWRSRQHVSTVKAMSWCPWQPDLLVTGGGTQDCMIRVWSVSSGTQTQSFDTKKQITSIHFAPHCREIVSTYGYVGPRDPAKATQALLVHHYPSFRETGRIDTSHILNRILSSCFSPDGTRLLTLCSDETVKIFKIFGDQKNTSQERSDMARRSTIR